MTELEHRLAKAEAIIGQYRHRDRTSNNTTGSNVPAPSTPLQAAIAASTGSPISPQSKDKDSRSSVSVWDTVSETLEPPPTEDDAFEWNEQYVAELTDSPSPHNAGGIDAMESLGIPESTDEYAIADGMASLSLSKTDVGYLGAASSAAVVRFLRPRQEAPRRPRRSNEQPATAADTQGLLHASHGQVQYIELQQATALLIDQPDPNRLIADSMIDAYFSVYHTSYPIVHEPAFRAQYSELIARPNGDCWKFLAYIVAAVGVFSTAKPHDAVETMLFAQAKSLMHVSYLESGNLTLIQALALMSNYLQRKDMPNSGFNYLGLASRMALGLGLHREFPGWNVPPLKLEMRRRVWWCLSVFDVGATITYGRPVSWPSLGVNAALPLNTDDRVS